jgi:hypothetical protein
MRSPVSRGALGECNTITSWGFGRGGLTFCQQLGNRVRRPHRCRDANERRPHLVCRDLASSLDVSGVALPKCRHCVNRQAALSKFHEGVSTSH